MTYTRVYKRADGSVIGRMTLQDYPGTPQEFVRNKRDAFLRTEGAVVFEVLDSQGKLLVAVTRQELEAGARQYRIEFVDGQWNLTGEKDYVAAWSLPFAVAVAKEKMAHYPKAIGFQLVDLETTGLPIVGGWHPSHDLAA